MTGCVPAHLHAGRTFMAQGNLAMAVEVLDAGHVGDPKNHETRDALIVAQQHYQRQLEDEAERLSAAGRPLLALGRMVALEDSHRLMARRQLPAEPPETLESRRHAMIQRAATHLETSLDRRAERGRYVRADLAECRRLAALTVNRDAQSLCERVRHQLLRVVVLEAAPGSAPWVPQLLPAIAALVQAERPELLEVADPSEQRHNARLQLYVGAPDTRESPFTLVERDAYHVWIPQRDSSGRQREVVVEVPPTADDLRKAKEAGLPPPEPTKVVKKLWEEVAGEYHHYKAFRTVALPYRVVVEDLRTHSVSPIMAGQVTASSVSRYYEYYGHPGARKPPPEKSAPGRARAAPLSDAEDLMQQAATKIPGAIVPELIARHL